MTESLHNAPSENLPPGCACVLMAPGTDYEARAHNPDCPVHNPGRHRARVTKYRPGTKRRNGF
jgi:hypothetical protein